MVHGSTILRIGLAAVFFAFAIMQVMDPVSFSGYLPAALQGISGVTYVYLNAALDAFLGITILFSLLGRIAPLIGAVHLFAIAAFMGWNDVAVRDFGLAMACLALVFIHEEHIPNRMRNVMNRLFNKH